MEFFNRFLFLILYFSTTLVFVYLSFKVSYSCNVFAVIDIIFLKAHYNFYWTIALVYYKGRKKKISIPDYNKCNFLYIIVSYTEDTNGKLLSFVPSFSFYQISFFHHNLTPYLIIPLIIKENSSLLYRAIIISTNGKSKVNW